MTMTTDPLQSDIRDIVSSRPHDVVVVLAAGLTIGALSGSPLAKMASWGGLLESGIARAVGIGALPADDAERLRGLLGSKDAELWIFAAEKITAALGGQEGGEFKRWLRETVGRFAGEVTDRKVVDALTALSDRGVLLATVNYDGILEEATGLPAVTWRQASQVERVLQGKERGILHLHGHWEQPTSLVFGVRSYDDVVRDEHARNVLRSMRMNKTFVLVGHGAGLSDPNWGSFLRWTEGLFAASENRHYRLVRSEERASVQAEHPPEQRIFALPYGRSHGELGPFLRSLLPADLPSPSVSVASAGGGPESALPVSAKEKEKKKKTTVIILVNIGDRDHHWLSEEAALELAGVSEATVHRAELVIVRSSVSAREWRMIAKLLDTAVKAACASKGPAEFVVAGAAPLPVFAYLGQLMRRMPGPIRVVNRRQGSDVVDVVPAADRLPRGGRDRFEAKKPSLGREREGRPVITIQCSREYAYNEGMTEPMIQAEGKSLLCSYQIHDPVNTRDDAMEPDEMPVLLAHLVEAEAWLGRECPKADGRVIAIGGPSWVAFWVGARLNPGVQGRVDFPNFVPGQGYVRALASPMHLAPSFTGRAKILFMTAEPDSEGRVRASKAAFAVKAALERELGEKGPFDMEVSGAADATELVRELERARPDILHLHLHGNESGALCFEDERGKPQRVEADTFVAMLEAAGARPTLIVLCACHSAALSKRLLGIAECVISMTTEVHYKASNTFSPAFYGALARGGSIQRAIEQGKLATTVTPPTIVDKICADVVDGLDPAEVVLFPGVSSAK